MKQRWLFLLLLFTGSLLGQEAAVWRPRVHLPAADTAAVLAWARQWGGTALRLSDFRASPVGWHYTLSQTQAGLPVFGGMVKVHQAPSGGVVSVARHLHPLPLAAAAFAYPEANLYLRMGETLGASELVVTQGYLPWQGQLRPAYRVLASGYDPAFSYALMVDATTGEELSRRDAATYWRPAGDTSGRGRIFLPDPITRSETDYGALFVDSTDLHQAVFDGLMDTVILRDLRYENGQFWLEGPHVKVEDRASFYYPVATSADGDFFFRRDETGFEDVMVYYHVDRFQRYVQRLGFDSLQNRPFPIDPHGLSNSDQSAFYENNGDPYILMGDGGVDDAEDADVIIHEYIHALSYAAAPGSNSGLERRGLDEGIADYFTAAYSYDMRPWRWHELFNWDGHNEFWPGRWGVSSRMYPPSGSTSIYTYGEIWAATLMQIRQAIGDTICDRLSLAHLYTLYSGMSLPQAAHTFLDVDSLLYGGTHRATITQYFCERGLLQEVDCSAVSVSEAPAGSAWTLAPNPASGLVQIRWQGVPPAGPLEMQVFNALGQEMGRWAVPADGRLQLALPAGLYLCRLQAGGREMGTQRLQQR
ncbi:MAG: hypothetical protein D6722_24705 [Bacteroidetes bacterium]|nr:MAG: hypothetical protein D6722_24705 [Bacteroidota bacterium]